MDRIAEIEVKSNRHECLIDIKIDLYAIESYETEHEIIKLFSDIARLVSKAYPGSRVSLNGIAKRIAKSPRGFGPNHEFALGSDLKPKPKRGWFSGKDFVKKWKDK